MQDESPLKKKGLTSSRKYCAWKKMSHDDGLLDGAVEGARHIAAAFPDRSQNGIVEL